MTKINFFQIILSVTIITSCASEQDKDAAPAASNTLEITDTAEMVNPHKMLNDAYQQFKEGNDDESIMIANKVLEIGRETDNDTLIGGALSSLCRNAQRTILYDVKLGILLTEVGTQFGDIGDSDTIKVSQDDVIGLLEVSLDFCD